MNRLRELAALFQAPVKVTEAKTMMGDWQGIKGVVLDAIADLEDKIAEGGALEAFMDIHGFTDMDTIADKDGKKILERMMVRTQQYKTEMQHLLDQVDIMVTSSDEPVTEMASRSAFSSGFMKSQRAKDMVAAFRAGEETFDLSNGDMYQAKKALNYRQLKKGMMVFASYNKYNQGAELYEILGVSDGKDTDKPVYDSMMDAMKANNAKTLRELEDADCHIVVRDLEDGEEGGFFYIFEGRIVRGSGAEPVSFVEVEKVKEIKDVKEAKNHLGEPEQRTYAGWKRACKAKNADCWFEGDSDIAEAFVGPKPFKRGETKSIGQWEGDKGSVYSD